MLYIIKKRPYQINGCYTSFTVILGGINLYTTEVTTRDSKVELINPPIKTIANGDIKVFLKSAIDFTLNWALSKYI